MFNRALWRKAFGDVRLLLSCLTLLLFAFSWLFVYLSSLIELGPLGVFLQTLPPVFEKLSGVPMAAVATPLGRISAAYVDPVVLLGTTIWAIGRGSDAVSGEIGRGTMEMLVAQPVRRISILMTQAAMTTIGSAVLALSVLVGLSIGVATVSLPAPVDWRDFVPGALNLFAMMVFLAGVSTLVSAFGNHRWRTIGLIGGFYVIELILKVIGRLVERLEWVKYLTFATACEPQGLVIDRMHAWELSLRYDGALIGLGIVCYLVAAAVFCHRDLPAPL